VRIGSIWKGIKQTGDVWDNFETQTFEFKFQKNQDIECIDCFDKVPCSNSHYISQDKYAFSLIGEKPDEQEIRQLKNKLTKLKILNYKLIHNKVLKR